MAGPASLAGQSPHLSHIRQAFEEDRAFLPSSCQALGIRNRTPRRSSATLAV